MFFEAWITFLPASVARTGSTPQTPNSDLARALAQAGFYLIDGQGTRAWVLRTSHRFLSSADAAAALREAMEPFGLAALVELLHVTGQQTIDLRSPSPDAEAPRSEPQQPPQSPGAPRSRVRVREPQLLPPGMIARSSSVPQKVPGIAMSDSSSAIRRRQAPDVPAGYSITEISAKRRAALAAEKLASLQRKP